MASLESIEKLSDSESFKFWKFQTTVIFKSQELFSIVNGEEKLEAIEATEEKKRGEWKKKDAIAQKIIVTSVDRKFLVHIINDTSSYGMYSKLCSIFEKDAEQQKCSLLQEFFNYKYESNSDMTNFISNVQNMAVKLKSLNQNIDDDMIMSKLLSSLPDKYKHFATAWDSTGKSDRTLPNLTSRLIAEEARSKNSFESESGIAFKASEHRFDKANKGRPNARLSNYNQKWSRSNQNSSRPNQNVLHRPNSDRKCYICDKTGHLANVCPSKNNQKQTCSICKKQNHLEKDCFFRKNKNDHKNVSFLTCNTPKAATKNSTFVVDSGCTNHMSNDLTLFSELDDKVGLSEILVAKNNHTMKSEGCGKIEAEDFNLKNVLYVPELSANLLSVNSITENEGEVIFSKNKVIISKDKMIVCEGIKQPNGLYIVDVTTGKPSSLLVESKKGLSVNDWHVRLGHPSVSYMKKLIKLAEGIEFTEQECEDVEKICEVCIKAKQTRQPFLTERKRAERPNQIIHTDLCGPIDPATWDNKRYALTLMDDFTHYAVVQLLESKDEVFGFIQDFVLEVEAMQNLRVSVIRSDNGGEYTSKEMKNWCRGRGIILNYTIPYTPQHNGKAERLNRTLVEKARALLFDSGLEKTFWGEAIRSAAYLLNRTPSDTVKTTPAEEWNNRKTNLSNIRKFGCDGYVKVLGQSKKLDPRSVKMTFIGYAQNGYRMWDPQKKKVIISRDVVFDEWRKSEKSIENTEKLIGITDDRPNVKVYEEIEMNEPTQGNHVGLQEREGNEDYELEENQIRGDEDMRPKRERKLPRRFNDYAMMTYHEAITCPEKEEWKSAIEEEKLSLSKNEAWKLVDKNDVGDNKILSNKWVFTKKENNRYKARLVVRGCEQKHEFDYEEVFSPVVSGSSLRTIFAIANQKKYAMLKFDVKTAFLYGEVKENVFMKIPEGYEDSGKICKLNKALYGLKQAPLTWNRTFTQVLRENGLKPTENEKCLFVNEDCTIILALYVDDGIIVSDKEYKVKGLVNSLMNRFEIKEEKNPNTFLGLELRQEEDSLKITQVNYVEKVLEKFNMENSKQADTPCEIKITPSSKPSGMFPFREAVGNLLYLSTRTRPDIAFSVNASSRHMENPMKDDEISIKRIMKYLVGSKTIGIVYKKTVDENKIEAFCDADYAGDVDTRRSTTGYIIFYGGGPISWSSRRQPIVAMSSTEAEYIAAADCCKELLYLKSLIEELTQKPVKAILNIDNQSAITLMKSGVVNKRSKHIDVRYHFIHEKVVSGEISVKYCPTNRQIADCLTKPLSRVKFEILKNMIVN